MKCSTWAGLQATELVLCRFYSNIVLDQYRGGPQMGRNIQLLNLCTQNTIFVEWK